MRIKQASERARKEKRKPSIRFTHSSSTGGEMTINPDDERVIDNCGADERRKKLAVELGDGMGDLAGG
jgi:hypothetical protein